MSGDGVRRRIHPHPLRRAGRIQLHAETNQEGSPCGRSGKEAVDAMREAGASIGAMSKCSFRPFPRAAVRAALGHASRVVVEKSLAVGIGGVVCDGVRKALSGLQLRGYTVIAGLVGRPIVGTAGGARGRHHGEMAQHHQTR